MIGLEQKSYLEKYIEIAIMHLGFIFRGIFGEMDAIVLVMPVVLLNSSVCLCACVTA